MIFLAKQFSRLGFCFHFGANQNNIKQIYRHFLIQLNHTINKWNFTFLLQNSELKKYNVLKKVIPQWDPKPKCDNVHFHSKKKTQKKKEWNCKRRHNTGLRETTINFFTCSNHTKYQIFFKKNGDVIKSFHFIIHSYC